jgi:hypothetical protein
LAGQTSQGKIAGILSPSQLSKEQLVALADGKPVVFPVNETVKIRQQAFKQAEAAVNTAKTNSPQAIFDISIRPGDPASKTAIAHRLGKNDNSFTYNFLNASLSILLQNAAGSRLTILGNTGRKYSLHVAAPRGEIGDLAPAVQLAIVSATGRKLIA